MLEDSVRKQPRAHHRPADRQGDRRQYLGRPLRWRARPDLHLQDRLTGSVVGAIEPRLRLHEIRRATRKPTDRLHAYERRNARVDNFTLPEGRSGVNKPPLSIEDLEMRLGGAHREAVDWQHVLWASREGDDAVHLGAQCDIAAGRADRRAHLDTVAVEDRMFMNRVSGAGVPGGLKPSAANPAARLSVQLS